MFNQRKKRIAALEIIVTGQSAKLIVQQKEIASLKESNDKYGAKLHEKNKQIEVLEAELNIAKTSSNRWKELHDMSIQDHKFLGKKYEEALFNLEEVKKDNDKLKTAISKFNSVEKDLRHEIKMCDPANPKGVFNTKIELSKSNKKPKKAPVKKKK